MKLFLSTPKSAKNKKATKKSTHSRSKRGNKNSLRHILIGKGPNVLPYRRFSNRKAVFIVVGMALVGIATVIYTLAATTTVNTAVEAENMTWNRGVTQRWTPNNITGKALYWNATGTSTVQLPVNATSFSVYVKGDQCNGAPVLKATLGNYEIFNKAITSKNWTKYSVAIDPKVAIAGKHGVNLSFANDYAKFGTCDRNLYIDKIVFTGVKEIPIVNPKPSEPKPSTTPAPKYNPSAKYNIIMIGWRPYEKDYAQLANANTNLVYRSIERTPSGNKAKLELWDKMGYKYFNNVAGSDWASGGKGGACKNIPLAYMDKPYSEELVKRPNSVGYFMHEMVSLNAACNSWNWANAAEGLDWAKLNAYMIQARAQNKKVIWSEPAQGWAALNNSASFKYYGPQWKDVLVPMFATNFRTPSFDHVPGARSAAVAASTQLGTPLGVSVQSWYFREGYNDLTTAATVKLANMGFEVGAKYYQIEGTYTDMAWGTDYMNGILAFSKQLGAQPTTQTKPQPTPAPQTQPVAIAKKPLFQLWNNVTSDHMYTTDANEKARLIAGKQYVDQGIAGYLYEKQAAGSTPLYRMWVANTTNHFYTASKPERDSAIKNGAVDQGIVGYIMTSQVAGTTPLYRLYSAGYPDHYYTADINAKNSAQQSFRKYKDEGNVGYVFSKP